MDKSNNKGIKKQINAISGGERGGGATGARRHCREMRREKRFGGWQRSRRSFVNPKLAADHPL
jgi:hypothetical protein